MLLTRRFSALRHLLTAEQLQLRDTVQRFAKDTLTPIADSIDRTASFDVHRVWRQLGDLGLLGITCPSQYGGSELGYLDHFSCSEEITRGSGSVGASYIAHSNLCLNQVVLNGSEEQKRRYLPKLCSGEFVGALAMSEAEAGSDVVSLKLRAKATQGGFVLNGTKMWITNGPVADLLVVYARTGDPGSKGITAFLVEKDFKGFQAAQHLDKLGIRGSPTSELVFENCFIPEANVLGQVNKGVYVLMSGLNYERLVLAAHPCGLMLNALDLVVPYVRQRKQFGQPIGEFQLIQAKLADMWTLCESARAYGYLTSLQADQSKVTNKECASVFLLASESAVKVALEAVQCFGGNGYINEFSVGRLLRDAKINEIYGGSKEIRRLVIGRELTKQ